MSSSINDEHKKTKKQVRGLEASTRIICTRGRKKILLEQGVLEDVDFDLGAPLLFKINKGHVLVRFEPPRCILSLTIYHPEAQPFCPLELKSSLLLKGYYDMGY